MLSTKFFPALVLLLAPIAAVYVSCNKDPATVEAKQLNGFGLKSLDIASDPYLTFSSEDDMRTQLQELLNSPPESWDDWDMAHNFTSLRSIFDDVVLAEAEIGARYDAMSEEELEKLADAPIEHSPLVEEYAHVLHINRTDPEAFYYEQNVWDISLAWIVNSHGIVKIGDKIYQHSHSFIKCIENGDEGLIGTLPDIRVSNEFITVTQPPLLRENVCNICGLFCDTGCEHCNMHNGAIPPAPPVNDPPPRFQGPNICGTWIESNTTSGGSNPKKKIIHYVDYIQNTASDPAGTYFVTTMKSTLRGLKNRLNLWWDNDPNADLYISGSFYLNHAGIPLYTPTSPSPYISPLGFPFSNSAIDHHTWVIQYFSDVDPTSGCTTLASCNLNAARNGGSSGVSAPINLP